MTPAEVTAPLRRHKLLLEDGFVYEEDKFEWQNR
jgi:hypothetical protein